MTLPAAPSARPGRCGRCSSAPNRGLSATCTPVRCTRPTPTMALRNARDLYTRRGEGASVWVVPADAITDERPGREGRVLRVARGQELPPRHVLHGVRGGAAPVTRPTARPTSTVDRSTLADEARRAAEPRAATVRRVAEYALWLGDDALDPRAAARRLDRPRARARGGRRARQHRPRPARPRPVAAALRRHVRRAHRGRPRLLARRARVPLARGCSSSPTATSRRPSRASCVVASTSSSCTRAAARRPTRRWRRSPRRRVKEVEYHRDHAVQWTLRLGGRHRRVAATACCAPSPTCGPTSTSSSATSR